MKEDVALQTSNYAGLRVIEFSFMLSGPYRGKLMADLGADRGALARGGSLR